MKIFFYFVLALILIGGGAFFFANKTGNGLQMATQVNEATGLKFSYRIEPAGYVLVETKAYPAVAGQAASLGGYQLMLEEEYAELMEAVDRGDAREGPQSIGVKIFENRENLSASVWADRNVAYSNINLAFGDVDREAVFAGGNAVRYVSDGLYTQDTLVLAQGGYIFVFSGPLEDGHPVIGPDYQDFLSSVEFLPTQTQ